MSKPPFRYSLRKLLVITTIVAAICALLARAPGVAAALGGVVAGATLPEILFPDVRWTSGRSGRRSLAVLLVLCGLAFLAWALYETLASSGERGMAFFAAAWGAILLSLAGLLRWLQER